MFFIQSHMVTFLTMTYVIGGLTGWVYAFYKLGETHKQQERLAIALRNSTPGEYLTWISK